MIVKVKVQMGILIRIPMSVLDNNLKRRETSKERIKKNRKRRLKKHMI